MDTVPLMHATSVSNKILYDKEKNLSLMPDVFGKELFDKSIVMKYE